MISVAVGLVIDYIIKDACTATDCKSFFTGILSIASAEVLSSIQFSSWSNVATSFHGTYQNQKQHFSGKIIYAFDEISTLKTLPVLLLVLVLFPQ